jgi:hypothetical protein
MEYIPREKRICDYVKNGILNENGRILLRNSIESLARAADEQFYFDPGADCEPKKKLPLWQIVSGEFNSPEEIDLVIKNNKLHQIALKVLEYVVFKWKTSINLNEPSLA